MNVSTEFALGTLIVALIGIVLSAYTMYRHRGTPLNREEWLEEQQRALKLELNGAMSMMRRQNERIWELEQQTAQQAEEIRLLRQELEEYRRVDSRPVVKVRKLTAAQLTALREMIVATFDPGDVELMLADMGRDVHVITHEGGTFEEAVRDVVTKANREGWLADLLGQIAERRPRRSDVQQLVGALRTAIGC